MKYADLAEYDIPSDVLKKARVEAAKLRALGVDPEVIKTLINQYGDKLIQEHNDAQSHRERVAPEGMTAKQLAAENINRACNKGQGQGQLINPSNSEARGLSDQQIQDLNFERNLFGKPNLTAQEIAAENFARVSGPVAGERAPKGMHPTRLAAMNLDRACSGLPALLPSDDGDE